MESGKITFSSIDEYILQFPARAQEMLKTLTKVIRESAPSAEEKISYQMPTFFLHGNLVHFAAHKNHIGFYPTPSGIEMFKDRLSGYKTAKGSIQFPLGEPLPLDLIAEIVRFRVAENEKKAELRTKSKRI